MGTPSVIPSRNMNAFTRVSAKNAHQVVFQREKET